MYEINEILRKNELKPRKYEKNKKTILVETDKGKYVIKEKNINNNEILDYLKTRNFNYIPIDLTSSNERYHITEYIESLKIPSEQKIIDLIDIVALLHNKTTHYIEITEDTYKEIYEDIKNNIEYLYSYYSDIITIIETKVFMSPCEYLLARNISIIFKSLQFSSKELEKWYDIVKDKKKQRLVVLHNNLELDHLIISEKKYLISWDKAKIGVPIYDIYKLYLKHGLEFEFSELLREYEKKYPLLEEEQRLFYILISLPQKIELNKTEYENTKEAGKMIDFIYKSEMIKLPYYSNKSPKDYTAK